MVYLREIGLCAIREYLKKIGLCAILLYLKEIGLSTPVMEYLGVIGP